MTDTFSKINCWTVLNIGPTKNISTIDAAYTNIRQDLSTRETDNSPSATYAEAETAEKLKLLDNAYQEAIAYAQIEDLTPIEVDLSYQNPQTTAINNANEGKSFFRKYFLIALLAISFILLVIWASSKSDSSQQNETRPRIPFNQSLLLCNEVRNAEPTENFNACLELAKKGERKAQERILWAYSRAGEYLNWNQVFNWLKVLRRNDDKAKFLSYAFMKLMSKEEEVNLRGERGIVRMVNQNYPPANVLMSTFYALEENTLPIKNNPLWLLERANKQRPQIMPATNLALVYHNGYFGKTDTSAASELIKKTANNYFPISHNNIAWFLSTLDVNPFTSNEFPIELANQVVEDPKFANRHIYIDTLAAAYAAKGEFEQAVELQQQALSLINELNWSQQAIERETTEFQQRLDLYKNEEAAVEIELKQDKSTFFKQLRTNLINFVLNEFYVNIKDPNVVE